MAHAVTTDKSQEFSWIRLSSTLLEKDFAPGLAYVGVSRVKSLNSLVLEERFDLSSFMRKGRRGPQNFGALIQACDLRLRLIGEINVCSEQLRA